MSETLPTQSPNEALKSVARKLKERGVLLYDALQGAERRAAATLISGRAVETKQDESGFVTIYPLSFFRALFRGQTGDSYVVNRLAK